jgi:hypothetical protein
MKLKAMTAALLLAVAGGAQAQIIFSDDFNSVANQAVLSGDANNGIDTLPSGWSVLNTLAVDLLNDASFEGNLCAGSAICVDLDQNGGITRTIALMAGVPYQLTYDLSGNRRGGGDETVNVVFGSANASHTVSANPYSNFTLSFTPAVAGNYTVSFAGAGNDNLGPILDNVVVAVVPEPESFALLLAGLGVVGFMARRRAPR